MSTTMSPSDTDSALISSLNDSLQRWWRSSQEDVWETVPGELVYGTGYNTWGVQTQQKALSAAAWLALQGDDTARRQVTRLLRFNLRSHIDGGSSCIDGEQWGHTWISVLGIERMMFALEGLIGAGLIPEAELQLLRRVLISEADWLLQEYEIVAGLVENNKPESNIWNGAILHRVALMYPDAPNAEAYQDKGDRFLYNGISVESDLDNPALKDLVVGVNFFESMALNHHRYLNVGYMVICLSNIAMLHFSFKRAGQQAPASLYHNVERLWSLVRSMSFDDGRLWRIGGDTRARYCYCQDYALPMWLLIEDYLGEDCSAFIDGWCQQVFTEQEHNEDDCYLSERLQQMRKTSPLYFTRLESDRACTVAMAAAWLEQRPRQRSALRPALAQWYDQHHRAYACRDEQRFASWVWDAGEGPTATCVPSSDSALCEWGCNLLPQIRGSGDRSSYHELLQESGSLFDGGFATLGKITVRNMGEIAEGSGKGYHVADMQVLAVALPDARSCVYLQFARMHATHAVCSVRGLHLKIPNDVWNGFQRRFNQEHLVTGNDGRAAQLTLGSDVQIDGRLRLQVHYQHSTLDSKQDVTLEHRARRGTGLRHLPHAQVQRAGGCLYTEDLNLPLCQFERPQRIAAGTVVVDNALTLSCDPVQTFQMEQLHADGSSCKQALLSDGQQRYYIAANFGDAQAELAAPADLRLLAGSAATDALESGQFIVAVVV